MVTELPRTLALWLSHQYNSLVLLILDIQSLDRESLGRLRLTPSLSDLEMDTQD